MFWPTQAFNVYGHDPIGVGLRGLPIGFAIMAGACIVLVLLSVTRGKIRMLMVGSTMMMTAGVGALSVANRDNMSTVYGLLVVAGLGIGGILIPASIITTIVCPDDLIATVSALTLAIRVVGGSIGYSIYYNVFYNKFVPILTEKIKSKSYPLASPSIRYWTNIDINIFSSNDRIRLQKCNHNRSSHQINGSIPY
jgi:hypothetical protein